MADKALSRNWLFFHRLDIEINNPRSGAKDLYLRRWIIARTPLFQVMLHKIVRPDADADMHDHPWSFRSLILKGGYLEQVLTTTRKSIQVFPGVHFQWARAGQLVGHNSEGGFHRIAALLDGKPAWTLVFTGPKKKSWSFLVDGVEVPWREYLTRKNQPQNPDLGDDW